MEGLPLGRIAAFVPEFAVKDLPLGRIPMLVIYIYVCVCVCVCVYGRLSFTMVELSARLSLQHPEAVTAPNRFRPKP